MSSNLDESLQTARMSAADYRKRVTAAKPKPVGSSRGAAPNVYRGLLCELCGQLVMSDSSPARLETLVGPDGSTAGRTVRHLQGCP